MKRICHRQIGNYVPLVILVCGCASKTVAPPVEPLSPEEVAECIDRLADQNIEFAIKFEKSELKGTLTGVAAGKKAKVKGTWEFNGSRENFTSIGIGDKEYKLEDGEWKTSQRTHYTDPISALKLVCSLGNYRFKGMEGGRFVYQFDSNLLFMDPTLLDDTTSGMLWINANTKLPEKVIAYSGEVQKLGAETVKWEFEVKGIGREHEITNPLGTVQRIEITSSTELESIAEILKQRFESFGFDGVKYDLRKGSFFLEFLSESSNPPLIRELTRPGKIKLYKAAYSKGTGYEFEEIFFICDNPTKPIFLVRGMDCSLVSADFNARSVGSSTIEFTFDRDLPEGQLMAIVMDGEVIGSAPNTWSKKLKIEGTRVTWIKAKHPLPCEVGVK
jgi:hypothetical protein